jgi:hypothetical protein
VRVLDNVSKALIISSDRIFYIREEEVIPLSTIYVPDVILKPIGRSMSWIVLLF